jgi:hypothetical protein
MKRSLIIFLGIIFTFLVTCCDKEMNYIFIVENKCISELSISFKPSFEDDRTITIDNGDIDTIFNFTIIEGTHIYDREAYKIFLYFDIELNSVHSKIDYLSDEFWEYIEKSDTYAVYYLEVNSTHFNLKR